MANQGNVLKNGVKTGPTVNSLISGFIENIEIPNYSFDEQRQIAARLKAQLAEVDKARQAAVVQLRDTRLLRACMFKAFFAELDEAPKKKLGDYAETTSGSTPSRGNKQYWQPAEIAWVKTGEVAFAPITATEEAISKTALAECSLSLLPPKTILIAMYGQGKTRGQSAILEIHATTNQACFAILPNDTWEPDFLYLWLKASYQDLRDLSADRGGNQANLNGALLNALEVPAPSKTEQQHIVARIQAAMTEIDAMENSSRAAMEDINRLPSRVLAQAFDHPESQTPP
uniref:Type I restriction modification DNA specificity domain-containing protein n=1 Tax=Candidatus Kentrum sp. DK TaxID=2126562 RepID=A0A450TN95_9GAMM|nr:MAG: Type I restriction modification DNA specificity domain-containing protein [Candidatus Kentron sp. DK]